MCWWGFFVGTGYVLCVFVSKSCTHICVVRSFVRRSHGVYCFIRLGSVDLTFFLCFQDVPHHELLHTQHGMMCLCGPWVCLYSWFDIKSVKILIVYYYKVFDWSVFLYIKCVMYINVQFVLICMCKRAIVFTIYLWFHSYMWVVFGNKVKCVSQCRVIR